MPTERTYESPIKALSDADQAYWQAVYADVLDETGDPLKAELAAWGAVSKAHVVQRRAGKSANTNPIIEGWGMLFTDEDNPDVDNEYFDAQTKTFLETSGTSLWYEHGQDPSYGIDTIGRRIETKVYRRGIWTAHELYADHPNIERTLREVESGELALSSDSIAHYVIEGYDEDSGYLGVWPIAGWSLTSIPAEPALGPVTLQQFTTAVKSAQAREARGVPASRTVPTNKDTNMNEEMIQSLAQFFGVEPTAEAVRAALEGLVAQLSDSETVPAEASEEMEGEASAEQVKAEMPDEAQIRAALGVDAEAPVDEVIARLQDMITMLQEQPAAEPAMASADRVPVKSWDYAAFQRAAGFAAKSAPAQDDELPYHVPAEQERPGMKQTRIGVANYNKGVKAPGLAELVLGIVGQKSQGAMKAMGYSVGPNGGYLLRQEIAPEMIELFRAATVVDQLGATYVPMNGIETLSYRKQLTGATATYRGEAQNGNQSNPTFGVVQLQLKELFAGSRLNRRLLKNSVENLESMIRTDLEKALSLRADLAALYGTGGIPNETGATGAEPRGIYYTTGVTNTTLATNGAVPEIDDFIDAWGRIEDANVPVSDSWGIAFSPRTKRTMLNMRDTTGQLISDERWSGGNDYFATTQIPNTNTVGTSADCSDVFLGAWEYLIYGVGQDVEIVVDESIYRLSGEVYIEATIMHDVGVAQPDAFEILTGVRAS